MNMVTRLMVAVAAVVAISAGAAQAEEIKVSAGGTTLDGIMKPVTPPFEKASGDKITMIVGGANVSFKVMDRGESDVAIIASTLDDMIASVKKEGYEVKDKSAYREDVVGKNLIIVAVNKDNPVKSLTREQLKAIYTGKAQNWKEVGGNDEPILAIVTTQNPATNNAFRKMVLDNEAFLKDNLDFPTFEEIRNAIATNPGAIGFGSLSTLSGEGTKIPQIPEFVRPIVAITKGAPSARVKRLIDFLKGEGRKYIKN